ncbi:MAG: hypothetical protein ACJAVK_001744 [Akkermansiaceae bacterium]|jgi:hypothetical protein
MMLEKQHKGGVKSLLLLFFLFGFVSLGPMDSDSLD